MRYVYNEERDRLACGAWNPHFFEVTYEETLTKELRTLKLHTCTDLERHARCIAEKYANADEHITKIRPISRKEYEKWLCKGEYVEIHGVKLPSEFVTDYLIAEDRPSKNGTDVKFGDLSVQRERLLQKDENLAREILESYEKTQPANDIIRE